MPPKTADGHEGLIQMLKAAIKNGRLSHAYIFAGPGGCGRLALARNLAKAVNCGNGPDVPCNSCPQCAKIDDGTHPDIYYVRGEGDSGKIKIDEIRLLASRMHMKPYEARYKAGIVINAELMTEEAANSFLKLLEEPAGDSVFILITQRLSGLLRTVVSRCQIIRLKPMQDGTLGRILVNDILDEFADDECAKDYSASNRDELMEKLSVLARWWRDIMVFGSTGDEKLLMNTDMAADITRKASGLRTEESLRIFHDILDAQEKLSSNVNPKLVLSALLKDRNICTK